MKQFLVTLIVCLMVRSMMATPELAHVEPLENVILKADLIVVGKVRSSSQTVFRVEVAEVVHDAIYGIKTGDYLKVENFNSRSCFGNFNIQSVDSAIFVLQKEPYIWKMANKEYLLQISNGRVGGSFMECSMTTTTEKWSKAIIKYHQAFEWDNEVVLKNAMPPCLVDTSENAAINQFVSRYRLQCDNVQLSPLLNCEAPVLPSDSALLIHRKSDSSVYDFPPTPPLPSQSLKSEVDSIIAEIQKKHPEMAEAGLEGKVFVKCVIEKDGSISNAKVIRTFYPRIDREVCNAANQLKGLIPGKNIHEKTVRSYFVIPFSFEIHGK